MRQSIAIAAVMALAASSTPALAQSRYGPAPSARSEHAEPVPAPQVAQTIHAVQPQAAPQAMLGWRGKTVIQPAVAPQPSEPQQASRAEPVAPWSQRMASSPPPAPAAPRALPAHLYDTPPPVPQPAPRADVAPLRPAPIQPASVTHAPAPAPAPRPAPAPAQTALLGGPPAPRPVAAPYNPAAPAGPRFYSVYREYGVAPDAIPTAPNTGRGQETTLRELPSTPSLAGQDDTQYLPPRPASAEAASRRTF